VGTIVRRIATTLVSYETISVDTTGQWHIKMSNALSSHESKFFFDTPYEEENFDGKRCKVSSFFSLNFLFFSLILLIFKKVIKNQQQKKRKKKKKKKKKTKKKCLKKKVHQPPWSSG
jgi:hypothetical protein